MWRTGLVALRHVGCSRTRARARVPCIGRRILNHCATREVPTANHSSNSSMSQKCKFFLLSSILSRVALMISRQAGSSLQGIRAGNRQFPEHCLRSWLISTQSKLAWSHPPSFLEEKKKISRCSFMGHISVPLEENLQEPFWTS